MRATLSLVAGLFLAVALGCSSATPVAIRTGDICEQCRRAIADTKIASEIAPPAGSLALKFDRVTCMARYLAQHAETPGAVLVTDYTTGRLIQARSAVFVKGEIDPNTKARDYFAFGDVKEAVAFNQKSGGGGVVVDWPAIRSQVAAAAD